MEKTQERTVVMSYQTCPLYQDNFEGHCKDCGDRQECMMKVILGKLQTISSRLDKLAI
jgi:hypothetical protein